MKDHDNCNTPSKPKDWTFRVDKEKYQVDEPNITGRQILEMTGKSPVEQFLLILSGHGQPREVALDEMVDLSIPGIERFRTLQRECREGLSGRRHFRLPSDDEAFLESLGCEWETVNEAGAMRLVVYSYPVPAGYNHTEVDLYLRIEPTYPDTQIDMFYVYPALALTSGHTINALAAESFDGKTWQRWSRHRVSSNAWRPGTDCVETHLALVNRCLADEGKKHG
ncbi:MAG: hypothetical protein GYB26_10115 [Gammaproteobacteria bacterium]|nr:hypothetical protein [Gammaproteobacteria bacterium]